MFGSRTDIEASRTQLYMSTIAALEQKMHHIFDILKEHIIPDTLLILKKHMNTNDFTWQLMSCQKNIRRRSFHWLKVARSNWIELFSQVSGFKNIPIANISSNAKNTYDSMYVSWMKDVENMDWYKNDIQFLKLPLEMLDLKPFPRA